MSRVRYNAAVQAAQAEALLPLDAALSGSDGSNSLDSSNSRPWPVVVLTALGAWLSALPLMAGFVLYLLDNFKASILIGVLFLLVAVFILRAKSIPLFFEQLAIPVLLTGIGLLAWTLLERYALSPQDTALAFAAFFLLLSAVLPQAWLRVLLGAAAAGSVIFALLIDNLFSPWMGLHCLLAVLLVLAAVLLAKPPASGMARSAAWFESVAAGWLLAILFATIGLAGSTFLLGAGMPFGVALEPEGGATRLDAPWQNLDYTHAASAALTVLAGVWLGRCWSALRRAWCAGVVLVLAALALMMPLLGACFLLMALCFTTQRWRLGVAAAVAAVWNVGAFYYALSWPLATKGIALMLAALVLGAFAFWAQRSYRSTLVDAEDVGAQTPTGPVQAATPVVFATDGLEVVAPSVQQGQFALQGQSGTRFKARWGVVFSAVLVLLVANFGIWQKEDLIRNGQAVFVPLEPVDPRSLMQGDYMALNFLPRSASTTPELNAPDGGGFEHPRMVFKRDKQGILSVQGPDQGRALAADEMAIQLVEKDGRWILVTDAFFFKEGEAQRWEGARFGEFRVDASGKALLVGLRGEGLKPL